MTRILAFLIPLALMAAAAPLAAPAFALPPPSDPLGLCPALSSPERLENRGEAPPLVPGLTSNLSWAALKTGFRAFVAWSSLVPEPAEIAYQVENASLAPVVLAGPASTQHVFVLDNLTAGATLCFRVRQGAFDSGPHAVSLANAHVRPPGDAASEPYTVNLLVLANEAVLNQSLVEDVLDDFAERLWDASDGHIRAGEVALLFGDPQRANLGHYPCWPPREDRNTRDFITALVPYTCALPVSRVMDATFTHLIHGAGGYADGKMGVEHPTRGFWLNLTRSAGLPPDHDEVVYNVSRTGQHFLHEFAHYAFGAEDLYAWATCYDAATRISVMGADPLATEFDSVNTPCPDIASYTPTWTRIRSAYSDIPERVGAPALPDGTDGGAYRLRVFRFVPET